MNCELCYAAVPCRAGLSFRSEARRLCLHLAAECRKKAEVSFQLRLLLCIEPLYIGKQPPRGNH